MGQKAHWKLFIYTCFGGCATGVSASKALIRIWEENPREVKIACLPAAIFPGKRKEMLRSSDKRILIDGCNLGCGAELFRREGMPLDGYIELTSRLGVKKAKQLPSGDLEEKVYRVVNEAANEFLKGNS